jgi:hypothetical protein
MSLLWLMPVLRLTMSPQKPQEFFVLEISASVSELVV